MTSLEERIKLELRDRKPAEVEDLILDNSKATKLEGLTEEFTGLQTLSLINIGLTSLDGLPKLAQLRSIDLSDNKIDGGLEKLVESCPQLYHVNLCANKIKEIETLVPLKKLSGLNALDLFDCEVTRKENYREKVFETLPQLKYLDGFDINDVEADLSVRAIAKC
jgi:Leucine-rich repeat (LRR) protein